jgi:hypothetical protein
MDYTYEFVDGAFDLIVTMAGVASVAEMLQQREALLADPRLQPGMSALYDLTGVDGSQLSHDDVFDLAADAGRFEAARLHAIVLASPQPLAFGLSRMYQGYTRRVRLADHFAVVDSVEEAYAWLTGLPPADG